jgi:hypothetical protein
MPMALTGNNGDNETTIGTCSTSLELSLFDKNLKEIPVKNLKQKNQIHFWIVKDAADVSFHYINVTNLSNSSSHALINGFLSSGFNLKGPNVSLHLQIKPENKSRAYLSLIKFGQNPSFNSSSQNYDLLSIFCPSDLKQEKNDSFYYIFTNMSQTSSYKKLSSNYVGYSIFDFDPNLLNCQNKSLNSLENLLNLTQTQINSSFSLNTSLWLRTFSSGCYFLNKTNFWSSHGMEIFEDTNLTHTHCVTNHLTTFAGGFVVLPSEINFDNVWANASFLQNPVIYSTVIALICLYIILAIWARWVDRKDEEKMGVSIIPTFLRGQKINERNPKESNYIYEIIVCTGGKLNAGTKSKV